MRAVDGLRLHRRVPPRIVKHDVAGVGQIQAGARRAQTQEEHARAGVFLEIVDNRLAVLGLAGEDVRADVAGVAFFFENVQHLHELREHEHLLPFRHQRIEQFKQSIRLAGSCVAADERRMAAYLSQPGERGEDVHLALVEPLCGDGLLDGFAAAAEFGQI